MTDTNYLSTIVRILETPKEKIIKNNITVTQFRARIPQFRTTRIIKLVFWGKLAHDVAEYYKSNDYILVEGYISLLKKKSNKKVKIVVLKVYPFLLTSDR